MACGFKLDCIIDPRLGHLLVAATSYSAIALTVTGSNINNIRIIEYVYRKYVKNVHYKHKIGIYEEYILEKALKLQIQTKRKTIKSSSSLTLLFVLSLLLQVNHT